MASDHGGSDASSPLCCCQSLHQHYQRPTPSLLTPRRLAALHVRLLRGLHSAQAWLLISLLCGKWGLDPRTTHIRKKISGCESASDRRPLITGSSHRLPLIGLTAAAGSQPSHGRLFTKAALTLRLVAVRQRALPRFQRNQWEHSHIRASTCSAVRTKRRNLVGLDIRICIRFQNSIFRLTKTLC